MPPGFAHRFVVFSKVAEVLYKTTDYYAPNISDAPFEMIPIWR
ncbi:dTDP-4-dehydrorhamnose 3,5-epimerase family protein [Fischerella thermalis]